MAPSTYVVFGLAYGDEGKGVIVDFLARQGKTDDGTCVVVRYNGGPQASHTVTLPDGRRHRFSTFGAGTLAGAATYLSKYVTVDPLLIEPEANAINALNVLEHDCRQKLVIDERCPVITPYDVALNRAREKAREKDSRGDRRHGSCGLGIGATMERWLLGVGDNVLSFRKNAEFFTEQLTNVRDYTFRIAEREKLDLNMRSIGFSESVLEVTSRLHHALREQGLLFGTREFWPTMAPSTLIFEGAQGALLDERYGFAPHTTWSRCGPANALTLLQELQPQRPPVRIIGVTRSYGTRHGAGPFPAERTGEHTDPNITRALEHDTNRTNVWQGPLRSGYLDLPLLKYALQVIAPETTDVALTHLDAWEEGVIPVVQTYRNGGTLVPQEEVVEDNGDVAWFPGSAKPNVTHVVDLPLHLSRELQRPVSIIATGPTAQDVAWRCRPPREE